jgi:hypothetical protein
MKRNGRPFRVSKDAAWLVSTAIEESRAKLALPNNDAPVGADVFVDSLEYLLTSGGRQRTEITRLRTEMKESLSWLAAAIVNKDWSGARRAQDVLGAALESKRRRK